jgi:anhydro-N-acetylmuramic acid kinase
MITLLRKILGKDKRLAVGLMSGTSLDGIDAALVEIVGSGNQTKVKLLAFETYLYSEIEKDDIRSLCNPSTSSVDKICTMNVLLGQKMGAAALNIISKAGLVPKDIDFVSSHGQTIYHMPETYSTLQIGELAVIAETTGCLTVGDFRPSDMAVGGQGAPLVPFTDALLFQSEEKGRVLLNIGGISNITVLPKGAGLEQVYGFDTGPGNVLIDEMVRLGSNYKLSYDHGGKIAFSGKINQPFLKHLLDTDPFIGQPPPKSTGRELYTVGKAKEILEESVRRGLAFEDLVATVTQYTIEAIKVNLQQYVLPYIAISEIIVSGGGVHNAALLRGLNDNSICEVRLAEDLGYPSDAKEAIAFAILGNECIHGNFNNLPKVTGARKKTVMGKIVFSGR